MQLHPVAVRMLLALSFILALSFAFGCKKKDPAEGKDTGAPPVAELDDVTNGEEDDPEAGTPPNDNDACAVPKEEVEGVIGMTISEVFRQGNWGIASTCSYAIPNGPPPVEISSIASTDLTSDRSFDGVVEVEGVGSEAVWNPMTNRLATAHKGKGKMLRIAVAGPIEKAQRLEIAKKLAALAFAKL